MAGQITMLTKNKRKINFQCLHLQKRTTLINGDTTNEVKIGVYILVTGNPYPFAMILILSFMYS
jgi:hypothetical protein